MVLSVAKRLNPSFKGMVGAVLAQHVLQFAAIHAPVLVFVHNVLERTAWRLDTGYLLRCRVTKHQHGCGKYIVGEPERFTVYLAVFHDVADIAEADPQALRGYHRILCRDTGIRDCQHQFPQTGSTGAQPPAR